MAAMEGYLDLLEDWSQGLARTHKRVWTPRFFRLNATWGLLEWFVDASMDERRGKIDLRNAQIATADELGELIMAAAASPRAGAARARSGSRIALENSRRFVFRVTERTSTNTTTIRHFHLCAECMDKEQPVADPARSRQYLDRWVSGLRAAASALSVVLPTAPAQVDARELQTKIAAFANAVHVSARVVDRREDADGKGQYELAVRAWFLQREVDADPDQVDGDVQVDQVDEVDRGPDPTSPASASTASGSGWQILEYSCEWRVLKTSLALQDLDAHLRQFYRNAMRDLVLPVFSGAQKLLAARSSTQRQAENQRRVQEYDAYWQHILVLPSLTTLGTEASVLLDQFLAIPSHVQQLKRAQPAAQQSLRTRARQIVPWIERERFERLYALFLEAQHEQEEQEQRASMEAARPPRDVHGHHRHGHRHRDGRPSSKSRGESVDDPTVSPSETDATKQRIARIGRKLLIEAFQMPSEVTSPLAVRRPSAAE